MSGLLEWILFLSLSAVAVGMAASMLLTMSMYRAGLALMASFLALAGLFILLDADLLAAIQVMMNVGGMLVMVLFMVMMMMDPGGEMMWEMKRKMQLPGPGALSMRMPRGKPPGMAPEGEKATADHPQTYTCPMHPEVRQDRPGQCPRCGMDLIPIEAQQPAQSYMAEATTYTCPMHPEVRQQGPGICPKCGMDLRPLEETGPRAPQPHGDKGMGTHAMDHGLQGVAMARRSPHWHDQMMADMAMSTAQLPWALVLGAASALVLVVLMIRTGWPVSRAVPAEDATLAVGELLLSRYMIGFEGAAFLILAGIVGAVIFAKRERKPAPRKAAKPPAKVEVYICPMHPEVRRSEPGQCPICGMDLIPTEQRPGSSHPDHGGAP